MAVRYRADKYLKTIFEEGIGSDGLFGEDNLKEVQKSCNSLFNDMCKVYNCDDPGDFESDILNKTSVVKAQMAEWLHTAINLLHETCLPMMSSARSKIEELQEENISDKKEMITLQNKVIIMKDRDIAIIQHSVQKEIKSYSSILQESCSTLQESCSTALSRRRLLQQLRRSSRKRTEVKKLLCSVLKRRMASVQLQKCLKSSNSWRRGHVSRDAGESVSVELISRDRSFSVFRVRTWFIKY